MAVSSPSPGPGEELHRHLMGPCWPLALGLLLVSPGKEQQCGIQLHLNVGAH